MKRLIVVLPLVFVLISACSEMMQKGYEAIKLHTLQDVAITNYMDGDYIAGEVALKGRAFTPEGEEITADISYIWSSDMDGELGTGKELTVPADTLTPGVNVISLQVMDYATGAEGNASVAVNVGYAFRDGFDNSDYTDMDVTTAFVDNGAGSVSLAAQDEYPVLAVYDDGMDNYEKCYDVEISDDKKYAYLAYNGSGIQKVNVLNPSEPVQEADWTADSVEEYAEALALSEENDYLYVAKNETSGSNKGEFLILNTSDMVQTDYIDTYPFNYEAKDVAVKVTGEGPRPLVALSEGVNRDTDEGKVSVIDINEPANFTELCSIIFNEEGSAVEAISISGNYAYVALRKKGLVVLNLSGIEAMPYTVEKAGECDIANSYFREMDISGNYVYLANYAYVDYSGMIIVDVSDPANPFVIGECDAGAAYDVKIVNNYAYVAELFNGMRIFDISTPSNPKYCGSAAGGTFEGRGIAATDHSVFLADEKMGMVVFDKYSEFKGIGFYKPDDITENSYSDVKVINKDNSSYAIFTNNTDIMVFDINDRANPAYAGMWDSNPAGEPPPSKMDVSGDYAFLTAFNDGIISIDISDPVNPVQADTTNFTELERANDVVVSGQYLYVRDEVSKNLIVIDISNPDNLPDAAAGVYASGLTSTFSDIAVQGDYAYLAFLSSGLLCVNISDPSDSITLEDQLPIQARSVAVHGNYAFVGAYASNPGLTVVDISDKQNMTDVNTYTFADGINTICVADNGKIAYATGYSGTSANKILMFDISIPESPVLIGSYFTGGNVNSIECTQNNVFIANGSAGFLINNHIKPIYSLYSTAPQIVQSENITDKAPISSVQINADYTTSNETFIVFEVSSDGTNWYTVNQNTRFELPEAADEGLKWRARLMTSDENYTPVIEGVDIYYWVE